MENFFSPAPAFSWGLGPSSGSIAGWPVHSSGLFPQVDPTPTDTATPTGTPSSDPSPAPTVTVTTTAAPTGPQPVTLDPEQYTGITVGLVLAVLLLAAVLVAQMKRP